MFASCHPTTPLYHFFFQPLGLGCHVGLTWLLRVPVLARKRAVALVGLEQICLAAIFYLERSG